MSAQSSALMQLVSFNLGNELFCVPIANIQEIIRYADMIKVPKAPDFIEGIINLRGKVIAVIDMKKRFNMPSADKTHQSRIIVGEVGGARVGFAVDSVSKVLRIEAANVEKVPAMVSGVDSKFIQGVAREKGTMYIILNLDKILTQQEIELLRTVE